ncbi:class C sortase [Bifidobacterium sp. SO1]|uniref:class C sortase n=1 Tax=Bifidobacterium sp. SO1 TaxID=2809029 RepID=UPI001BDBF6D8|nr:class C sortase [Bifidobacterium sp. SO1]MBT1161804.1 class C sortase [Bifidobacterium sp. SO1]
MSGQPRHGRTVTLALLAVLLATLLPAIPQWMLIANDTTLAAQSSYATGIPAKIREAEAYNRRLAAHQGVLGEADGKGDFSFRTDAEYQRLLRLDSDGMMGELEIPSISLTLPILHGADDKTLMNGAGHLHGSSLPVGGESTHTVLTGHRGVDGRTLFTRLDEMKTGDAIVIDSGGRRIGYRVDKVWDMLTPEQALGKLRIRQGEDRLSLVTCTPLWVNTHRIVVTAVRDDTILDAHDGDRRAWILRHWTALLPVIPSACLIIHVASVRRSRRIGGSSNG